MGQWRVGVDVGGTFTDFAVLDAETGTLLVDKVPTTPDNPARGIIAGLERLLEHGVQGSGITSFLHGTTITTNTLIQMNGARVGLLLTAGLRGVADRGRWRHPTLPSRFLNASAPRATRSSR
jgi:N-methylhydantoinase A